MWNVCSLPIKIIRRPSSEKLQSLSYHCTDMTKHATYDFLTVGEQTYTLIYSLNVWKTSINPKSWNLHGGNTNNWCGNSSIACLLKCWTTRWERCYHTFPTLAFWMLFANQQLWLRSSSYQFAQTIGGGGSVKNMIIDNNYSSYS